MGSRRRVLRLLVRSFPGWDELRGAVAQAVGVALDDVQAHAERETAAVWLDGRVRSSSFALVATLELDETRVRAAADLELAKEIAAALREDVVLAAEPEEGNQPLLRAGGGRGSVRVSRRADGTVDVVEVAAPLPAKPLRDLRARGILQRFEAQAEHEGEARCWPRKATRQIIAAATEARLAVTRVDFVPRGAGADFVAAPPPRALWAEVVFRSNGEALAVVERAAAGQRFVVDLLSQEGYFAGRTYLPLADRSDEELAWALASLDASLSMAAAADCPPDAVSIAELDRLRQELARRRS